MTLDKAIRHLEETLTNPAHEWNCPECRAEHEQLLAWLKDYKRLLEMPKGDLISREALKKALTSETRDIYEFVCLSRILEKIDNAPTVEPCYQTTSCLDCKNYDKENHNCPRYCEVIKEAIKSRPQGGKVVPDNRDSWRYEE